MSERNVSDDFCRLSRWKLHYQRSILMTGCQSHSKKFITSCNSLYKGMHVLNLLDIIGNIMHILMHEI